MYPPVKNDTFRLTLVCLC